MDNFTNLLELAEKNKKRRTSEKKENVYCMLKSDEVYSAIITDAECDEEDSMIVLYLTIIKDSSYVERDFSFKLINGISGWYENICETLGTNGNPSDLIGKCIYMYIEKNGNYQNLRVNAEMDKEDFEKMISDINSKSNKRKKKAGSKKTPYVKDFANGNEETEEEDDIEEELLDDDEDDEE